MDPTYTELARCCEDTFTVRTGTDSTVDLVLVTARHGTYPRDDPGGSLTFRGPREPALDPGTVRMSHARLGEFPIYVVPVDEDESGREYEATFS